MTSTDRVGLRGDDPILGPFWIDVRPGPGSAVVQAIEFLLPGTPPTQNRQRGAHWGSVAASAREWQDATRKTLLNVLNRGERHGYVFDLPWVAADVLLTFRFARPNRRDIGNLIGSAKPIIDGLCPRRDGSGRFIVKDDSYVYIDDVSARVVRRLADKPSVTVRVSRCEH